jgi:phage-related minor tail protein
MADFSINAEITANSKGFKAGLAEAQSSLKGFGDSLKKTILAVGSFTVALQGISKVSKFASEATKEFARANSAIVKGTGATGSALAELSNNVRTAMREGVGRSASEVGEMIADLNTRFGVTGTELTKLTKEFDKFSNVTGVDTKQSIESLADVMAKWNISTEESNALMDQLVYASQASGLSVTELTSALKNGQTTFDAFGMSVTESIGFLGQLKTQGVDTTAALSALKIGMAKFASSGGDVSKQFDLVAKRIQNAKTESEALQIAVSNFGAKGGAELVKVFKNNGLDNFISQLENAEGTLARTEEASRTSADALNDLKAQIQATFFSGETDSYLKQIIDEIKIGFTEIDSDTMYDIFNNIYKAVQICVNSIDAIIHGDWETAWDYAKLVVLKVVQGVSEGLQKIVDDIGTKLDIATGLIGGFAAGFGILTGNLALTAAAVGGTLAEIIARNTDAMKKTSNAAKEEIDKIEKDIIARTKKNTQNGSQQLLKDLQKTQTDVKTQTEKTGEIISNSVVPNTKTEKKLNKFVKGFQKGLLAIGKDYEGLETTTEEYGLVAEKVGESAASVFSQSFGDMFTMLGQEIVKGEAGWEDYAAVAVQGVAQVLQSLGSELLALSAVRAAHYDYGTAAIAATAATAAFVASGVLTAVSSAMKSSAEETKNASEEISDYGEAIESLEETFQDLIEGSTSVNGFTQAVTAMDNMIEAATANIKKAQAQLESFDGEVYNTTQQLRDFLGDKAEDWSDSQVWEYAIGHMKNVNLVVAYAIIQQDKLNKKINQTKKELEEAQKIAEEAYTNALTNLKSQNEELQQQIDLYKEIYNVSNKNYYNLQLEEQLVNVKNQLASILAEFTTLGSTIGDTVMEGLEEGLSKEGFLSNMKKIIKNNLLKIAVYTESFQSKLADIGAKLAAALSGEKSLKSIREELEELWDTASKSAEKAEKIINESFGDIADDIDDATEEITDALTTFEDAMQSFADSIKDTGASIANEIVNGLTNGLSQSDFLSKMQTWLRNNLIQMVVYTDSMKSEIQAISDKIAEIMGSGRMFTTDELHEIRRDLSYAYESATSRMGTIDEILSSVFSGYATGTQNATAGLHLVGEAGPELVRFSGGEQVFNANETRDILGSGNMGNNFNVTFVNTQDTTAMAMMNQLRQYNRELAINGIL